MEWKILTWFVFSFILSDGRTAAHCRWRFTSPEVQSHLSGSNSCGFCNEFYPLFSKEKKTLNKQFFCEMEGCQKNLSRFSRNFLLLAYCDFTKNICCTFDKKKNRGNRFDSNASFSKQFPLQFIHDVQIKFCRKWFIQDVYQTRRISVVLNLDWQIN